MKKSFTVFFVAGAKDGETLGTFETEAEAIRFARQFQEEHEDLIPAAAVSESQTTTIIRLNGKGE